MDSYRLSVFAHLVFAVVLTGLALFWSIMLMSLRRSHEPPESQRLLGIVNAARWPHVAVPYAWRLPLPWVTWATIAMLVATGVIGLSYRGTPDSVHWWIKMALFTGIALVQALVTRTPSASLIRINFALVITTVIVSGWAIR